MKQVFVVGFFDEVNRALRDKYPQQIECGLLMWVRLRTPNGKINLSEFIEPFRNALGTDADQILVVLAALAGEDWVEGRIQSFLDETESAHPGVCCQLKVSRKARDSDFVFNVISAFDLPVPAALSMQSLRSRLGNTKVLCVRPSNAADYEETLRRQGFPDGAFGEFFDELAFPVAKQSMLNKALAEKAGHYQQLLYAYEGLRHLDERVKAKYQRVVNRAKPSDVVREFRHWLLGQMPG